MEILVVLVLVGLIMSILYPILGQLNLSAEKVEQNISQRLARETKWGWIQTALGGMVPIAYQPKEPMFIGQPSTMMGMTVGNPFDANEGPVPIKIVLQGNGGGGTQLIMDVGKQKNMMVMAFSGAARFVFMDEVHQSRDTWVPGLGAQELAVLPTYIGVEYKDGASSAIRLVKVMGVLDPEKSAKPMFR
ncbi:hypothetical protein KSF73_03270 [Burkholderiaceae bacterium DAT-1]|nr:hypothetical protein [Burkholderiaceae bacterium DAT-1]